MKKFIIDLIEKIIVPELPMIMGLVRLMYSLITLDYLGILYGMIVSALGIWICKRIYIDDCFNEDGVY
jgi:hypothetical protein